MSEEKTVAPKGDDTLYDVIVIGAGVVGPCIARCMAREGRKVLIAEREWTKPNRIVGELMQPAGLKALRQLGMIKAVNGIEAIEVDGYYISYDKDDVTITYPEKSVESKLDTTPVPGAIVTGDEDKLGTDSTIDAAKWADCPHVKGVAFHHGDFLMNLRKLCLSEPNVTKLDGNVTDLVKDDQGRVCGITVADKGSYKGRLVICCDGIYSKFRKELDENNTPTVGSYFIGMDLVDAKLPSPNHGHVLLNQQFAPVLLYQISLHHSRILCAYRSATLPKKAEVIEYLKTAVLPNLPESLHASFETALSKDNDVYRAMPNQYLTAIINDTPGFACIGDSLNMRHPLTGGGMTVGLNDAVLFLKMMADVKNEDLGNEDIVLEKLLDFHAERKKLTVVINTLSLALYTLFAADDKYLRILQNGAFQYFKRGGLCVDEPISLLSGIMPSVLTLVINFFAVAFYACLVNIKEHGLAGFPVALYENVIVLWVASQVLLPILFKEILT